MARLAQPLRPDRRMTEPLLWNLDEAARQAARQYNAKVLSAHTVQEGERRIHVIKLLTRDGVVKVVRITVRKG